MRTTPPDLSASVLDDEPSTELYAELERRRKSYLLTHDSRCLWPDVDLASVQTAADAIGRAVQSILGGSRGELAAEGYSADALGIAALVTGVGPLLGHWSEGNLLVADDDIRSVLATHLRHGRARSHRIRARIRTLASALAAQGVIPGVIKGFHTSRVYFPEPGTRPFSDVDLVVRHDEIEPTRNVLRAQGYVEREGRSRPYKRAWSVPGEDERIRSFSFWHERNGWTIELYGDVRLEHLRGQGGRLHEYTVLDERWDSTDGVFMVPSQPQLIALLAVHASGELYASRLLRLVELVFVVRGDTERGTLEWDAVSAFLRKANVQRFAYPAFQLVEQLTPGTIDPAVLRECENASTVRTRSVLAGFTPTSPVLQAGTSLSERLMWSTGWLSTIRRGWAMVAPTRTVPARQMLGYYQSRLRRLLAGSVRWRAHDGDKDGA